MMKKGLLFFTMLCLCFTIVGCSSPKKSVALTPDNIMSKIEEDQNLFYYKEENKYYIEDSSPDNTGKFRFKIFNNDKGKSLILVVDGPNIESTYDVNSDTLSYLSGIIFCNYSSIDYTPKAFDEPEDCKENNVAEILKEVKLYYENFLTSHDITSEEFVAFGKNIEDYDTKFASQDSNNSSANKMNEKIHKVLEVQDMDTIKFAKSGIYFIGDLAGENHMPVIYGKEDNFVMTSLISGNPSDFFYFLGDNMLIYDNKDFACSVSYDKLEKIKFDDRRCEEKKLLELFELTKTYFENFYEILATDDIDKDDFAYYVEHVEEFAFEEE